MSVSFSPESASQGASAQGGQGPRGAAAAAVTVAGYTVLLVLGFAAGLVCGLAASWLSWLWGSGALGMALAGGALVVFLGLLYTGCRAAGWAMGSRLGAGLPAAGWVGAGLLLTGFAPSGDVVMLATVVSYAFLLGGIAVVAGATVLSGPRP
ncbi:DUF6113 family protein [Allosalinactinospora lopnorensis]|uniref:DUF6113 family protein n=1 Tax=Allosalinactinospora lopnorensis TaxID=1352348 RepID=UPI000623C245|nr:DUF6113 family protein [Allosalinactinospora lopnorensis]